MGHLLSKYIFHETALSAVHVVVQWKQYILVKYNDRVGEKSSTHSPLLFLITYIYIYMMVPIILFCYYLLLWI